MALSLESYLGEGSQAFTGTGPHQIRLGVRVAGVWTGGSATVILPDPSLLAEGELGNPICIYNGTSGNMNVRRYPGGGTDSIAIIPTGSVAVFHYAGTTGVFVCDYVRTRNAVNTSYMTGSPTARTPVTPTTYTPECGLVYRLTPCSGTGTVYYTRDDLSAYVGQAVIYDPGTPISYLVEIEPGAVDDGDITDIDVGTEISDPRTSCEEHTGIWGLIDCSGLLTTKLTEQDLSAYDGNVVRLSGDTETCWNVRLVTGVETDPSVTITEEFANCLACNPDDAGYNPPAPWCNLSAGDCFRMCSDCMCHASWPSGDRTDCQCGSWSHGNDGPTGGFTDQAGNTYVGTTLGGNCSCCQSSEDNCSYIIVCRTT